MLLLFRRSFVRQSEVLNTHLQKDIVLRDTWGGGEGYRWLVLFSYTRNNISDPFFYLKILSSTLPRSSSTSTWSWIKLRRSSISTRTENETTENDAVNPVQAYLRTLVIKRLHDYLYSQSSVDRRFKFFFTCILSSIHGNGLESLQCARAPCRAIGKKVNLVKFSRCANEKRNTKNRIDHVPTSTVAPFPSSSVYDPEVSFLIKPVVF